MSYFPRRPPNYDKRPMVPVAGDAWRGWPVVGSALRESAARTGARTIVVEWSPDALVEEIERELVPLLDPQLVVRTSDLLLPPAAVEVLVRPWLGDDPVFGRMSPLTMDQFLDPDAVAAARAAIDSEPGRSIVIGPGASLVAEADLLIHCDVTRWQAQARQRSGRTGNLGASNAGERASLLYKRSFFVDWRVAGRLKAAVWQTVDWVLDTETPGDPKLAPGADVRAALRSLPRRPFRFVPFFDPAPWGGQWMKEVCDLDATVPNFGWCFDCVPEENSLILSFDGVQLELPAQDLVLQEPRALLGDPVHARFGAEFPIRFDFLDTMGGGNLSLQVHPLTEYIQEQFGMHYTQDESYYLLDAGPGAHVYLGLKEGVDPVEFRDALQAAQADPERPLNAERFVGIYPARRHDHFLIPAGTLHCSGADSMVLEISATPFIFTFKQWDWGRLGLDGRPRPVHLDHGMNTIQWDRQEPWVRANLIDRVETLSSGPGWRSERTGLHEREFIETVRTWFNGAYPASTGGVERGGVHVLNLVDGEDAVVESPHGAFEPFDVHYAETFVVPAAVGEYTVRPGRLADAAGQECGTVTASVRFRA